jgi:hypothetical protein
LYASKREWRILPVAWHAVSRRYSPLIHIIYKYMRQLKQSPDKIIKCFFKKYGSFSSTHTCLNHVPSPRRCSRSVDLADRHARRGRVALKEEETKMKHIHTPQTPAHPRKTLSVLAVLAILVPSASQAQLGISADVGLGGDRGLGVSADVSLGGSSGANVGADVGIGGGSSGGGGGISASADVGIGGSSGGTGGSSGGTGGSSGGGSTGGGSGGSTGGSSGGGTGGSSGGGTGGSSGGGTGGSSGGGTGGSSGGSTGGSSGGGTGGSSSGGGTGGSSSGGGTGGSSSGNSGTANAATGRDMRPSAATPFDLRYVTLSSYDYITVSQLQRSGKLRSGTLDRRLIEARAEINALQDKIAEVDPLIRRLARDGYRANDVVGVYSENNGDNWLLVDDRR